MLKALGVPGDVRQWLIRRLATSEVATVVAECDASKRNERAAAFATCLITLHDGDEVWEFRSPPETWRSLRRGGRAGLCVLRGQEVLAIHITMLS
jgi:hypothetical protein